MLDQIIKGSDNVEDLDPKERPALQMRLDEAWSVIGDMNRIQPNSSQPRTTRLHH